MSTLFNKIPKLSSYWFLVVDMVKFYVIVSAGILLFSPMYDFTKEDTFLFFYHVHLRLMVKVSMYSKLLLLILICAQLQLDFCTSLCTSPSSSAQSLPKSLHNLRNHKMK